MGAQMKHELDHEAELDHVQWQRQLPYAAPTAQNMNRHSSNVPTATPQSADAEKQIMNQPLISAPQMVMITVPDGVIPGQDLQVKHPITGSLMIVKVPPGLYPGQQFTAQFD